ncbi:hypothetical protein D3C73_1358360 [compost metagenome]
MVNTYLYKDKNGWVKPVKRLYMLKNNIILDKYIIVRYYENNNNYITILSKSSSDNPILDLKINDNMNTNFNFVNFEYNDKYNNYWNAVIKELPKDYEINIDGEIIKF